MENRDDPTTHKLNSYDDTETMTTYMLSLASLLGVDIPVEHEDAVARRLASVVFDAGNLLLDFPLDGVESAVIFKP
jgi:hypothetical protein